jgi:hypothetical protein
MCSHRFLHLQVAVGNHLLQRPLLLALLLLLLSASSSSWCVVMFRL